MSALLVDGMGNALDWVAVESDGVTASTELSITNDMTEHGYGADQSSGRIALTTLAVGHILRSPVGGLDLSDYDELRLSLRSARKATGAAGEPFLLELRLGGGGLVPGVPPNTWHRYLPISQPNRWETVRLGLEDLAPAVRGSLDTLQFTCVDAPEDTVVHVDDVYAVRPEMIADADRALVDRFDGEISVGGMPVVAEVLRARSLAPGVPTIRFYQYDVRYAEQRSGQSAVHSDYSADGYRIHPAVHGYDIYYAAEIFASGRPEQAQIIDFLLSTVTPRGVLLVNGDRVVVELHSPPALERLDGHMEDHLVLYLKVEARQEVGLARQVRPVSSVKVETDYRAA